MKNTAAKPRFFRASLIYFSGSLLSRLALFFMLPLYTARIPTADMGLFDAATAVAVLVSSVFFLDIGVGVMRFYLGRADEEEGEAVLASGFLLILTSTVLFLLFSLVLSPLLPVAHYPLVVLYGLTNALYLAAGLLVRAKGNTVYYAAVGLFTTLLQIALNLILILGLDMGYVALYISYAVATGTGALLLLLRVRVPALLSHVSAATVRRLLRFCLPLGAGTAAFWALSSLNRVLLTALEGEEAGGVFAVSLKLAQVVAFLATCFQLAWQELSFAKSHGEALYVKENGRYYTEKTSLFLRVALAVLLLLLPLSRVGLWLFPNFIAPAYGAAKALLPLALLGAVLLAFATFLEPLFGAAKRTGQLLLTTAVGAFCNLLFTLVFLNLGLGAAGAHLGMILALFVTVVLRLLLLYRNLELRLGRQSLFLLLPLLPVLGAYYLCTPLENLLVFLLAALLAAVLLLPEIRLLCKKLSKKKGKC